MKWRFLGSKTFLQGGNGPWNAIRKEFPDGAEQEEKKEKNRGEDDDYDVNVLPQDFLYPVRKINIHPR